MDAGEHTESPAGPPLLVVGASAGGVHALMEFVSALPPQLPAPVLVAQHLAGSHLYQSSLDKVLQRRTAARVKWAEHGEVARAGTIYLAPQDAHLTITRYFALRLAAAPRAPRPCVDRLFCAAAAASGSGTVGVVLSGTLSDGARGAQAIRQAGGTVMVQDRRSAQWFDMPRAVLQHGTDALSLCARSIGVAASMAVLPAPMARWFPLRPDSAFVASAFPASP